jgi:ribosomal-protein-alanine N-acetyltransferase
MSVEPAGRAQLPAIERLLHMGRYVSSGVAREDLPGVVDKGMTLLAGGLAHPWGLLMVDPEERPTTLPADAPDRAQVRAIALRHGPWLAGAGAELGAGLAALVAGRRRSFALSAYAPELWMQRLLEQAGFSETDAVVFLHCTHLAAPASRGPQAPGVSLRAAELADVPPLAALDAETFIPLWHFGRLDLMELLLRGQLFVATRRAEGGEQLVGYAALLPSKAHEAHLARLAVHPAWQGQGIGRLLLDHAKLVAAAGGAMTLALNTQRTNTRSQRLYRAAGFVETGLVLPVYLRYIPAAHPDAHTL